MMKPQQVQQKKILIRAMLQCEVRLRVLDNNKMIHKMHRIRVNNGERNNIPNENAAIHHHHQTQHHKQNDRELHQLQHQQK